MSNKSGQPPHDGGSVGRQKKMRRKDRARLKSGKGRGLPKANVTGQREGRDMRGFDSGKARESLD